MATQKIELKNNQTILKHVSQTLLSKKGNFLGYGVEENSQQEGHSKLNIQNEKLQPVVHQS